METIKNSNGVITGFREMLWISGKCIKSPTFKRKTDCRTWLSQQQNKKARRQVYGESSKAFEAKTFSDFCEEWLESKSAQGLSRATLKKYQSFCAIHFGPMFGNKDLKEITQQDIESFQVHIRKNHNSKGTNLIMTTLKAVLREAIKSEYLLRSPGEFVKRVSVDSSHYSYWSKAEINQFLRSNYQYELYDLFLVAINTGMRKGELAGLKWDRVSFTENTITISRTRDNVELKDRTKTNLIRFIPMNEIVKATLLSIFQEKRESDYVFLKPNSSEPINPHHLSRDFGLAQEKAGIKNIIRFHDLRHTFASQFVMGGGNMYDLQKLLGHTDIAMTLKYAHHDQSYMQKAIGKFSLGSLKNENFEQVNQILTIRPKLVSNL